MYKAICTKCNGTGFLSEYRGIASGRCFSCNGKGYNLCKTEPTQSEKYLITAISKETDERINVFHLTAKSESEATRRAMKQLSRSKGYYAETVNAIAE